MRKLLSMLLILVLALGVASVAMAEAPDYKIAIVTGTVSQNEEEFRAAERQQAKDPDHIVVDTYPDNFSQEMETTISKIVAFADDPAVKAIIVCQGVPGTKAGFDKVREMRDDIFLAVGVPQEDPAVISAASDIVLYANEAAQGDSIMEKAAEWGIEVFIHYSFPRHMAMETIVARHTALKANAETLGIEFVDAVAPDPTAEAGITASQQFILEDVPQKMKQYEGKKVAFFTTNCGMQPPLQQAVLDQPNAYYPLPCCPSPYHGFPSTLGLELAIGGDDKAALEQIAAKLAEHDAVGRYSTWPAPLNMTLVDVAAEYARGYIAGTITERNNPDVVKDLFNKAFEGSKVEQYTNAEGTTLPNYYVASLPQVDFNDYLK
ncbi:DUF3798 domain-containing protein [Bacillota bacterium Meth-B3]